MIAVIDYKAGNLTSVVKALNFLGTKTLVTQNPDVVRGAKKVVLPDAGHAANIDQPAAFNAAVLGFLAELQLETA